MRGYSPAKYQNYSLPIAWRVHVSDRCRGSLSDDHRREISNVLWSIHQRRQHRIGELSKSIGFKELDARFGAGLGYAVMQKSGFFAIGEDWKKGKADGYTREIQLTDHGQQTIDDYFDQHQDIQSTKQTTVKPQTTIPNRDNFKIRPQVQVNVDALKSLSVATDNPHQRTAANQLTHSTDDNDCLTQYYTEHRGGRLFIHAAANLQNAPSDVRDAALAGFYDYDLKNCYPTIYGNVADRLQLRTPTLNYYLSHRDELLNELAAQMKCDPKQCKAALLALMHFAGVNGIIEATGKKDQEPFTEKQAKRFLALPKVKRLREEFKQVGKAWIAETMSKRGRYFVNNYGNGCSRKLPARKLISHLLQGIEAIAIETVRETYGDQIALLMHDGFVTTAKINQKYIEGLIRKATGVRFQLTCSAISSEFHIIKPTIDKPLQAAPALAFSDSNSTRNRVKGVGSCGRLVGCGVVVGVGGVLFTPDSSVLFKPIIQT